MIKISSKQTGSAHVVIIVILVLALVATLGFVFWQNFMQSSKDNKDAQVSQNNSVGKSSDVCAGYGTAVEKDKVFCSKNIGVEFKIPEAFAGKFQKKENYDVFKGGMEDSEGSSAGKSLEYYEAVVSSGKESLLLSVAKEPLRSGYSSVNHALQQAYFNEANGILSLVNSPTRQYDSKTDTFTTTGSWSAGEQVPSFNVGDAKVYHGKTGDAGVVEDGYLTVVKGGVVVIKIKHVTDPMGAPVLDADKSFADLDASLKQLKFLD
jgi:flagellar basal body-associated protein FliL